MGRPNYILRKNGRRIVTKRIEVFFTETEVKWVAASLKISEAKAVALMTETISWRATRDGETWTVDQWGDLSLTGSPEDEPDGYYRAVYDP